MAISSSADKNVHCLRVRAPGLGLYSRGGSAETVKCREMLVGHAQNKKITGIQKYLRSMFLSWTLHGRLVVVYSSISLTHTSYFYFNFFEFISFPFFSDLFLSGHVFLRMDQQSYKDLLLKKTHDIMLQEILEIHDRCIREAKLDRLSFLSSSSEIFQKTMCIFNNDTRMQTFNACWCGEEHGECEYHETHVGHVILQAHKEFTMNLFYSKLSCPEYDIFVPYSDVRACVDHILQNTEGNMFRKIVDMCFSSGILRTRSMNQMQN